MNKNASHHAVTAIMAAGAACALASCATTDYEPDAKAAAPEVTTTAGATTANGAAPDPAAPDPTAPPAPDLSDRDMVSYTVQPGDSLWRISRDKNVSITDLKAANEMTDDVIVAGTTITLPLKKSAASTPDLTVAPAPDPAPAPITPAGGAPAIPDAPAPIAPTPPTAPVSTGDLAPPPPPPGPTE